MTNYSNSQKTVELKRQQRQASAAKLMRNLAILSIVTLAYFSRNDERTPVRDVATAAATYGITSVAIIAEDIRRKKRKQIESTESR